MIKIINLEEVELELLREHKKKARNNLIRDRAHAVILNHKGYNAIQIADILDRDRETTECWLNQFKEIRIASIFTNYENNSLNNSHFTKEQLEEIKETLSKPPEDKLCGLGPKFWSVKNLKEYMSAAYQVVYESDRSYHHLLEINNYSFKSPEGFSKARDDALVRKRTLEIKGEINKLKDDYEIFFADECSLHFETEYRKAWLKKGEKTILKVNKGLQKQSYFGAWNIKNKQEELIPLTWQNTETMIMCLQELSRRYPNKKLCIIWDNAGWHRSKELKSHLGKNNQFEHIKLLWLPPYAPDHNPQEHIWKYAKGCTKNQTPKTFIELQQLFESSIENKTFNYRY